MKGAGGGVVHKVSSITPTTIRPPDFLRFCPSCVEDDRQKFKGCYWHRLHQVPGVLACPEHKTFLEDSEVRARNRSNSYTYVSAEQANLHVDARLLDLSDIHHRCLMFISRGAGWLLNQRGLVPGYDTLHDYYMQALNAKGLAYQGRFVHAARLAEALRQVYPQPFLAAIQCDFDGEKEYSWPFKLIKELRLGKANHPLRHLLLMGLLGHTPNTFFRIGNADSTEAAFIALLPTSTNSLQLRSPTRNATRDRNISRAITSKNSRKFKASQQSKKLFGSGPWPCLNKTCQFYKKLIITSCRVVKHWEKRTFEVGVFKCICGFTYRRSRRDRSPSDLFRFDTIKEYGGVWKDRLRELWGDLTVSLHRMAPLLGVAHNTVKYQAVLLGLEFPRNGPGHKIVQAEIKRYPSKSHHKKKNKGYPPWKRLLRDRYRKELLEVLRKNPSASRSIINKQLASRAYGWLYMNDKEWLDAHQPPPFKRVGSNRKVDWDKRDALLVEDVRLAVAQITAEARRPVRMTVRLIGRHLDKDALLQSKKLLAKMPLTVRALSELVETHSAFAIRCVRWAASCYRHEGVVPSISALAKRAGMTMTTTHRPEIRAVINEELESLRNCRDVPEIKAA